MSQSLAHHLASGPIAPDVPVTMATPVKDKWRNIIGFWILGLCNNYPYVIMLSAAFDILKHFRKECTTAELYSGDINCTNHTSNNNSRDCNPSSTSVSALINALSCDSHVTLVSYCCLPGDPAG